MKIYKIRNEDGLFSTGGENPQFIKTGKVWPEFRFVKSHLTLIKENTKRKNPYKNCKLVVYDAVFESEEDINFESEIKD